MEHKIVLTKSITPCIDKLISLWKDVKLMLVDFMKGYHQVKMADRCKDLPSRSISMQMDPLHDAGTFQQLMTTLFTMKNNNYINRGNCCMPAELLYKSIQILDTRQDIKPSIKCHNASHSLAMQHLTIKMNSPTYKHHKRAIKGSNFIRLSTAWDCITL